MLLDEIKPRIVFGTSWGSPLGRVVLAGLLRHHTGVPERPLRKLGNYALVYLLNGKGYFQDARGLRRTLLPGDFWFLFPDVPHWYGPGKGSYWDELYIVFTGPLFDLWRSKGLLDPAAPILHLEPVDYWLRRIEEVIVAKADPLQQICSLQLLFAEVLQASGRTSKPEWVHGHSRCCRMAWNHWRKLPECRACLMILSENALPQQPEFLRGDTEG